MKKRAAAKPDLLLIDGRNWCYRNGYTRVGLSSRGRPSGVIYGCLHSLLRLNRFFPNAAIVVCWDGKDASKSWRHKLCAGYKSNRVTDKTKAIPQPVLDIRAQIPVVEQVLDIIGIRQFSVNRLEADDLIGVMATHHKDRFNKVLIYSTDRDFYQLIVDNVAVVRDIDKSKKGLEITAKEIEKKYGVAPKDWLKYRAFVGDAGDRIDKPIKGIGEQKALKILAAGVDASKSKPHVDYARHWKAIRLAYKLSKIVRTPDSRYLPRVTSNTLRSLLKQTDLFRQSKTMHDYKRFVEFLADYDLEQIMASRHKLWSIR